MFGFNMLSQSCLFQGGKSTLVTVQRLQLGDRDLRSFLHVDIKYMLREGSIISGSEVAHIARRRNSLVVLRHVRFDAPVQISSKVALVTF